MRLRKVSYQDEQNRYYDFLTNNFDIEAEDVAFLYKKRWVIIALKKEKKGAGFQIYKLLPNKNGELAYVPK